MAKTKEAPWNTLRFAAVSDSGRRSSTWRIWTGGPEHNELYIAARGQAGQVKVSLHKSGYCQHGLTAPVRGQLPLGEREALDRWQQPPGEPGVLEPAYLIYLAESEFLLQGQPVPAGCHALRCDPDRQIVIGVFFVDPPLPDIDDGFDSLQHLARLPATTGTAVDVLWVQAASEPGRLAEVRQMFNDSETAHELPLVISKEWDYAYGFGSNPTGRFTEVRWATEIAVDNTPTSSI